MSERLPCGVKFLILLRFLRLWLRGCPFVRRVRKRWASVLNLLKRRDLDHLPKGARPKKKLALRLHFYSPYAEKRRRMRDVGRMDRTLFQLFVIFIVGLALGVGQYRERLYGEGLEKQKALSLSGTRPGRGHSENGRLRARDGLR